MHRLDNIEDWTLTPEQRSKYHNDICALNVVWFGLEHLYATVLKCEQAVRNSSVPRTQKRLPEEDKAQILARCAFDWYAVSACNFVSLIGWIAKQVGLTTEEHKQYLTRVLPAVEIHRNKIAAHYSRHSPRKDGHALQLASTMFFSLPQVNGRFVANAYMLSISRKGVSSDSAALLPWSVVETHDELRKRYSVGSPQSNPNG